MNFKELEAWDRMLSEFNNKELESVIMLAVSELSIRLENCEGGANFEN